MSQLESLRLTGRARNREVLSCLVGGLGAWPSALFGLPRKPRRLDSPDERIVRERIVRMKLKKGLTCREMAKAIGVHFSCVAAALTGKESLPRAWIPQVAAVLQISEKSLLHGVDWQPHRGRARRDGPSPQRRRPRRKETPVEQALRLRVRQLLCTHAVTRQQAAKAIGVQSGTVWDVLSGRCALPPAWLKPLAHLLGMTVAQLLGGIPWKPRKPGTRRSITRLHA